MFLPFHTVYGVLKARMLKWFAIPFSSGPCFVRLHDDPSILGGPTWHNSQFNRVRQGCGPCDQFHLFSVIVVFIWSALWEIRIRGLWKLPDGRDWLWRKLGLVLMGEAILSKSLIQFSVDGQACVPSPLTWGQTMVEVMKIMVTSFKRSHARIQKNCTKMVFIIQ